LRFGMVKLDKKEDLKGKKQIHWTFREGKKDEKENIREIQKKNKETIAKGPEMGIVKSNISEAGYYEGTCGDDSTHIGKLS